MHTFVYLLCQKYTIPIVSLRKHCYNGTIFIKVDELTQTVSCSPL